MRALILTTLTSLALLAPGAICSAETPQIDEIVQRMESAQAESRARMQAYSVHREYRLSGDDPDKTKSYVVAAINFLPPSRKDYKIQTSEGSGRGEKIVRKVLEHESKMAGQSAVAEVNSTNYDFTYAGEELVDGSRCFILNLSPRRETKELIKGRAWVDATSFLIRKVEGSPAKSPSWWIKQVTVTLHYREVDGLWMQHQTRAVAQVRFAGTHVLTARDLDVRTATTVARANGRTPSLRRPGVRSKVLIGAGVLGPH